MKSHNQGRQDFLQWINELTECDYPKIELLSDGIGYCQIIDALHPGAIYLSKLNFMARFPDEYTKNLKVLDDAFSKLKIDKVVPIDKLSKCKFQDNMAFLQWMYNYASKVNPFVKNYRGYSRRLEAFEKQHHGRYTQMSAHLIPNTEFLKFKQTDIDGRTFLKVESTKAQQAEDAIKELEIDIKTKMDYNWKLIYALDDLQYQRDVLYGLLTKIDQCVQNSNDPAAVKMHNVIMEEPIDFAEK
ncbi:unnamed protein product (macronuclear) [Paramecium tetraurelia]|uniref:Calponin-homology (CH) domain-containing protein n=1 Tax=Paramecium tetraurelia TaxID=5888 RepID=A0CFK4_PARTE|nr:uncharacterized protein GSPATT00038011001 [Paramecium tetraurelia]CAK69571.1 unnamed protein product [Paramecium tetraurelia]|eukprot:XP_001436968.1 hypothetical protein (macronuclear) [Paramecium tetraurelia strain d4-2]